MPAESANRSQFSSFSPTGNCLGIYMKTLSDLFGGQENFGIGDAVHDDSSRSDLSVLGRIGVKYCEYCDVKQYLGSLLEGLN